MPELPEVETTCRGIKQYIEGQQLTHVIVRNHKLRWPISSEIKHLKNIKIEQVKRRGKYIIIETQQGAFIIHLGMSGRLNVIMNEPKKEVQKHDHVDFVFNQDIIIRYTDPRRFGSIFWTKTNPLEHFLLEHLGPEPLEKNFTGQYLYKKSQKSRLQIKKFIMDAKIVVGVGNIYANEALFASRILPFRLSNTLRLEECNLLVKNIRTILKTAIKKGGTTLKDFLTPEGQLGYFSQKLLVYGREGKPCIGCGARLSSSRIDNRATVYCNYCQN